VPDSLVAVLTTLEHHALIVGVCVLVLIVVVIIIVVMRSRWWARTRARWRAHSPTVATTSPEDATALLNEWKSQQTPLPLRPTSGSRPASQGSVPLPTPGAPLRLVKESAGATRASATTDRLLMLADMLEKNLLTRKEFEEQKRLLLEHDADPAGGASTTSR
jgi:hypothetical protein